jgi:hypothetical protein
MNTPFSPFLLVLAVSCIPFSLWAQSDIQRIESHFHAILAENRAWDQPQSLTRVSEYIFQQFSAYTPRVHFQEYRVDNRIFRNVVASFGPEEAPRWVMGAHYDVCGPQPGADDNASGVVGLLELARFLADIPLTKQIELVAYTLEEPPFFRTEHMGSFVHAKSLADAGVEVEGMVSLEMIGYFAQEKGTQSYPLGILKLFYGSRGNYVTVVRKFGSGKFARQFTHRMKRTQGVPVKVFQGPAALPGIDFSDHANYWKFGFSAVMITDTAFYRNPHYHRPTDTLDTLDLESMRLVIDQVCKVIVQMATA